MTEVTERMRALQVKDRQHPQIRYTEMGTPKPGIGDVLVEVRAASFTPTELEWPSTWVDRSGRDRTPVVPAHELSGAVRALGYGTTGLDIGEEVYGVCDWYRDGSAADFVAVEARNLAPKPGSISHTDAASLPLAGLTAWQALYVHGDLAPEQRVVITGAGGGVGTIAVQLAREAGAHVVAVARRWAHQLLGDLGADEVLDADELEANVANDADLLVDLVGGDLATRCSSMVRSGGKVISVVDSDPPAPPGGEAVFFVVEPDRGQLTELTRLVEGGRLRPIVGAVAEMARGAEDGFAAKQRGGIKGKIVLTQS